MQVYTNGLYTPTIHRVVNADPTKSRISIPFFYECAFEAKVSPIPQLLEVGREPTEQPIRYGTHLVNKVLKNFNFENPSTAIAA